MPQINLLPWREELRKKRNQDFLVVGAVTVVLMGAVVLGVHTFYQSEIDFQAKRNAFLEENIAALDKKIKEIEDLEKERERLIQRKEKIEELQSGRPDVVHLVDELVASLPEGVYFTDVKQKGNALAVQGIAQSNARVSSLMRRIEASEWLENPALVQIKADSKKQKDELIKLSEFSLRFQQSKKKTKEDDGDS